MKFSKSKKEPKKSPEEEYTEHISTLTETELRDLHKDLKIDHYGNSTAALINTASGVGLLSMRSTTRRYRTECMQIEAMEARMKEMGWTPHPNRYRDAVPIALGVAAGTTSGMTFGLINVEKNAKRTKEYVKRKDLFKTKELVESEDTDAESEIVEEVDVAESAAEHTQAAEMTTTEHVVVVEHSIARKPVPARAATGTEIEAASTNTEAEQMSHPDSLDTVIETTTTTQDTSAEPIPTETNTPPVNASPATTEQKPTKKEALFSQVSVMNKKMRSFNFKRDKEEKEATTVTVTEIACDDALRSVVDVDAAVSHDVVGKMDSTPMYASEGKECVV